MHHSGQIGATSSLTSVGGIMTSVGLPLDCFYNETSSGDDQASQGFTGADTASMFASIRDDCTVGVGFDPR